MGHLAMCLPENKDIFDQVAEDYRVEYTRLVNPVSDSRMLVFEFNCTAELFVNFIEDLTARVKTRGATIRPGYYNQDSPYEVIKVIRAWSLDFELGNAVKYIARAGKKDPTKEIEDLEKAKTYLQMKIDHLKSNTNGTNNV